MIDRDTARALAERHVRAMSADETAPFVLLDEHTLEEDFGWVFFYQSARFVETRNPLDRLAGNGPIVVDRSSGEVSTFWSGQSVEQSIRDYRERRDRSRVIAADPVLSALREWDELDLARADADCVQFRFASEDAERDEAIRRAVASFRGTTAWAARRDDDATWTLAPARWFLARKTSDTASAAPTSAGDRNALARWITDKRRQ